MKILFINPSDITMPGGVHEVIRKLGKHLSERGHEITVFQFNPLKKQPTERIDGFRIIRVSTRDVYGFSMTALKKLSELISEWSPDVVHVHGYHTLFSPVAIIKIKKTKTNLPVVFSPHYMPHGHNTLAGKWGWPLYNKLSSKFLFPHIDHVVVASKFERDSLLNDIPGSRGIKTTIIPHGVDELRQKTTVKYHSGREITLLFAGYLHERKGVQFILAAMDELVHRRGFDNIVLKVIGEGEYKKKLMSMASRLKLEEFIIWQPFVPTKEELQEEIRNADVLLLLSKNENYGIIVAEALALGTPVIVTDNSALHEFLSERGCFGVHYPPTPEEIASVIVNVIKGRNKIGPFTKKIRPWEEVARDYEKLYTDLVSENE